MDKIYFSSSALGFYPESLKTDYESGTGWPADAMEITQQQWQEYIASPPAGKTLGSDDNGLPAWVEIPPLTPNELIAAAGAEKQNRITVANEFINRKQWPGKAVLQRLKDEDKAQYNLWLDYLDALTAIDTTEAPDINWPEIPA